MLFYVPWHKERLCPGSDKERAREERKRVSGEMAKPLSKKSWIISNLPAIMIQASLLFCSLYLI